MLVANSDSLAHVITTLVLKPFSVGVMYTSLDLILDLFLFTFYTQKTFNHLHKLNKGT